MSFKPLRDKQQINYETFAIDSWRAITEINPENNYVDEKKIQVAKFFPLV